MGTKHGRFSLSVADKRGGRSTYLNHVVVDDTLTIANAYAAIGTVATLFGTVSDAGIVDGTFSLINRAVDTAPSDDSDVASGAVFDFSNTGDSSIYGQFIPSFLDSLVEVGGHIDITSGVPAAYVTAMVAAILGGTYANPRFQPLDAGLDAFLSSRKRRKRIR